MDCRKVIVGLFERKRITFTALMIGAAARAKYNIVAKKSVATGLPVIQTKAIGAHTPCLNNEGQGDEHIKSNS
ncbi:MAG: hypothetical protein ACFE9C_14500 [Candidatus Hodarchaeota archaeon]